MLSNFSRLNVGYIRYTSQSELTDLIKISNSIKNISYDAKELKPLMDNSSPIKFEKFNFNNVSFNNTKLEKVYFQDCNFEDCLFIGTLFFNCEIHNCNFKNCNTHKIKISKTYVNPTNFSKCFNSIDKSNIAVHLFQQLLNNSGDERQSEFRRSAEFHFRKWQGYLNLEKINKANYNIIISWKPALIFLINFIYKWTLGYGLRIRNFIITSTFLFSLSFAINYFNWNAYELKQSDLSFLSFNKDTVNLKSNFYYTLDATTKIIDSQIQPTSDYGMNMLVFQGFLGFIFLGAIIQLINNRLVK